MSQDVDFQPLTSTEPGTTGGEPRTDLRRLSAVPVDLSVEIGRTRMTVGETLELREGSVVTLDRMAGEPVDLLVNGTPIARGEVVVIDEQFGLRLTRVLSDARHGDPSQTQAAGSSNPSAPGVDPSAG
jgi:flagellar motor switch protein FliN/FliY